MDQFDLEGNENKYEIWDYEKFNSYNVIARYWKKLIAHCNIHYRRNDDQNKLVFINQTVYRLSQLHDEKQKKVFINNFFKTKYFSLSLKSSFSFAEIYSKPSDSIQP